MIQPVESVGERDGSRRRPDTFGRSGRRQPQASLARVPGPDLHRMPIPSWPAQGL